MPKSRDWLTNKAQWKDRERMWVFQTGQDTPPATLQFGYLDTAMDKYRYGSSEYTFIAFDELTEFPEDDYKFMFSRLRATESIRKYGVPYRMYSASNPGGKFHDWVKNRFVTIEAEADLKLAQLKDVYYKAIAA